MNQPVMNYCPIDPYRIPTPMRERISLPETPSYTRDNFFNDILQSKNKGQSGTALRKALAHQVRTGDWPTDVWEKLEGDFPL
jgi:hypothetical protein